MGSNSSVSKNSTSFLLFTDGACSGNPGPGGWGAIVVSPVGQVTEIGGYSPSTTNNRMEMTAVCEGLLTMPDKSLVKIYTDSTYVIQGVTKWSFGWKKRGWQTAEGKEVANVDLWQKLLNLTSKVQTSWGYVRGHNGHEANERCDQIAVDFSRGLYPNLYHGPVESYSVDVVEMPLEPCPAKSISQGKADPSTTSYLSLVGGVLQRHKTWDECKQRVHGRPNVKFKKAKNHEEELAICREWGVDTSGLKSN